MKPVALMSAFLFCFVASSPAAEPEPIAQVKSADAELLLSKGAQLLDVRTKEEWQEGHLKGATLIPVTEDDFLEKAKATLVPGKDVVVYCRSGGRSAKAAALLRAAGFTVHDVAGGISAWQADGKGVVKP